MQFLYSKNTSTIPFSRALFISLLLSPHDQTQNFNRIQSRFNQPRYTYTPFSMKCFEQYKRCLLGLVLLGQSTTKCKLHRFLHLFCYSYIPHLPLLRLVNCSIFSRDVIAIGIKERQLSIYEHSHNFQFPREMSRSHGEIDWVGWTLANIGTTNSNFYRKEASTFSSNTAKHLCIQLHPIPPLHDSVLHLTFNLYLQDKSSHLWNGKQKWPNFLRK